MRVNLIHSLRPHNPAIRFLSMPVWHIAEVTSLPAGIDIQYQSDHQREITFLTTDNKNCVLAGIDDNGVCGWFVHTKLEIKIVVHGSHPPTDILHHPAGR